MSFTICENWQVLHTVGFALTSLVCFSVLLSLRVCVWVSECIPNWFVYVFWLLFRLRGDYSVREELGDFFTRKGSWREFEFALYSAVFFFYSEKEQGCCIERCPVGSLIVGAMMILGWTIVSNVGFLFVWVSVYGCCLGDGDFYQEEKVCVCVCFFQCSFSLLRVQ